MGREGGMQSGNVLQNVGVQVAGNVRGLRNVSV
jgi:hypothetical protein